ncbi:MAG: inositol-1-monophosphatase [Aeromonas sp.]
MHPMLNIAVRAARSAGQVVVKAFAQPENIEVIQKGSNNFVTNVDREAEATIIHTLKKSYPEHGILAEESGEIAGTHPDYQWIIDPLDGTANFIKGLPHFAISIALRVKGKTEQAVIYDPIRDELFTATRGSGAQLNGYRVRVGKARDLSGTVLATGFPVAQKHQTEAYLKIFLRLFMVSTDLRRGGCPALDLAYVAAGRVDGYFEIGLKPWSTTAGELIAKEAGAIMTDFVGGHNYEQSGNVVVANARVLKDMLGHIREDLPESLAK